jgi:hypothetical protein
LSISACSACFGSPSGNVVIAAAAAAMSPLPYSAARMRFCSTPTIAQ